MEMTQQHHITDPDMGFIVEAERQAAWRSQKAAEYPEDERNQDSAEALEELAAWVRDNRADPVVEALNEALDRLYADPSTMEGFAPTVSERLGRYGFGYAAEPEAWLSDLVKEINAHLQEQVEASLTMLTREEKARLVGRFDPRRGGHAPGHLREAFVDWVESGADAETLAVGDYETVVPIAWLLGVLWNCSDIMPSHLCDTLDIQPGSTYAMGARQLRRAR